MAMEHSTHDDRPSGAGLARLAVSATLHCLTGCAIGEVLGMVIGTARGWSDVQTIVLAVALAGALIGCGSESAPGYDSASKEAAEALAKNGNDISKLTPEQKAALESAAVKTRPTGGMSSTNGGGGTASPPPGTTG